MKIEKISLTDFAGGLNDRDPASALDKNELQRLENYFTDEKGLLAKRPGQDIVQNTPINPNPFTADASTALLLHLDEASSSTTIADSSGSSRDLTVANNLVNHNTQAPGVFPIGAPLGQQFFKNTANDNTFLARFDSGVPQLGIDGAAAVTFEAWVSIKADFSGAPTVPALTAVVSGPNSFLGQLDTLGAAPAANTVPLYQTGAPIIATAKGYPYQASRPLVFESGFRNGITIHRDYNSTTGTDGVSAYAKFTVKTNGIAGTVTSVQTLGLPVGDNIHIRGVYDSVTQVASIYVNGDLQGYATVNGGGTVNNSDGDAVAVGGWVSGQVFDSSQFYDGGNINNPYACYFNFVANSAPIPPSATQWANVWWWQQCANEANAAAAYCAGIGDVTGQIIYIVVGALTTAQVTLCGNLATAYQALYSATDEATALAAYALIGPAIDAYNAALPTEQTAYDTAIAHLAWPNLTTYHGYALNSYAELAYPVASASMTVDEVRVSTTARAADDFPFENPRGMGFEFSKSDGTRQAVVCADDKLWYTLGDGAWTQMKLFGDLLAGFSTPAFSRVAYWDAFFRKDILYLANGVDSRLAWDGATLVYWMAPTTAPVLSLGGAGTITAGSHEACYTYLYGDYETGPSPSATIANAGGEQINVGSIPPRHSNCTGVRIYMKKNGGNTWYLAREIAHTPGAFMQISGPYAAGSPSYDTDSGALGPADGTLGSAAFPAMESQVQTAVSPNPQYLLAEHDRAFACGMLDQRYTLRWSELGAPDVFNVFSFAQAASNQGNLIGMSSYYGEVHCSKDGRATLILRGSNPQNWTVLETLHPSVGAIDHWSYVHRYPFGEDRYVLCFAARDGFYKYAGQEIECISDKIKGTISRLASGNATRNEWDVTTTAQWQAQTTASSGGTATLNIQAPRYETDGLREEGGTAKIVNQLDYLGLWTNADPLLTGNVIATAKAPGEGCFYLATDDADTLQYTTDNFQTKIAITGNILDSTERIIEIVKQGASDAYFLITDTANADGVSSGGGNIYTVNDPTGVAGVGPAWTKLTSSALYYDLDVPIQLFGGPDRDGGRAIGNLNPPNGLAPYNIFINHAQRLQVQYAVSGYDSYWKLYSAPSVSGIQSGLVASASTSGGGTVVGTPAVTPGFYALQSAFDLTLALVGDISYLYGSYTRREFPLWRGGTFRPQAYWDTNNSRLVFLASTAEDSNGNRSTYLRTIDTAGTLTNQYTAQSVASFTPAGTDLYFHTTESRLGGFGGYLRKSTLATPGTVISSVAQTSNLLPLRFSYNASANTTNYVGLYKSFFTGSQEFWTYKGALYTIPTATLVPALVRAMTANGDSGSVFSEIVAPTATPYAWYVATSRISSADPQAVWKVSSALVLSAYKSSAYESPSGSAAVTGIISNLLFVPSSGIAGDYLWADRLYWYASAAATSDDRMVQLGVPGNWTVQGIFESGQHNLGDFSAFDNLQSAFSNSNNSNGLLYEMRNAADTASLAAATYQQQVPNSKITAFAPVQPYVQWRLTFTWVYDSTAGATVTASPYTDFVIVGFFLGESNLARTIGFHWEGRTFWCCAEDGATQNNVVLVYQKSNQWMKIYGWAPKSFFRFRNQMTGLENYQLMRYMTGRTDAGAQIVGAARTGTIMGWVDKMLSRLQANVLAFANNLFSSLPGYVKLTPYQGDTALDDGAWVIEIPSGVEGEVNRVLGEPNAEFSYSWVRALSMEVKTSEDTTGDWIPATGQPESIQQIDLELQVTGDTYDIPVK